MHIYFSLSRHEQKLLFSPLISCWSPGETFLYLCTAILTFCKCFPSLYAIFYNIIYVNGITSFFKNQVVVPHES